MQVEGWSLLLRGRFGHGFHRGQSGGVLCGGNRQLIETAKRLAQRDQQVAQMAREYRKQNGHLDEGFYQQLQQFSEANPLFRDMGAASGGFSIRKLP